VLGVVDAGQAGVALGIVGLDLDALLVRRFGFVVILLLHVRGAQSAVTAEAALVQLDRLIESNDCLVGLTGRGRRHSCVYRLHDLGVFCRSLFGVEDGATRADHKGHLGRLTAAHSR